MKYYSYTLNHHKIEFHKSCFGKETVKVDGHIVSVYHSIVGAAHFFNIDYNEILLKTDYNLLFGNKVCLQLFKNRKKLDSESFEFRKMHRFGLVSSILIVSAGVFRFFYLI